jgi:HPt (histidine-containing phosphotransfer) domain-containing protein
MLDRVIIDQLIEDIGQDVFVRLSGQFLDETAERLADITACRQAAQWRDMARHAHSLKSTSQSFGLQLTGRLAQSLQIAGDREDLSAIDLLIPDLIDTAAMERREFEALRDALAVSLR